MANQYSVQQFKNIWERIRSRCVQDGDCLVWTGCLNGSGYGNIKKDGRTVQVHRAVYEFFHGPIPDGLTIDHVATRGCHSRACCNEAHLEPVTRQINTLRGDTIPARHATKTHCPRGHELAGDNLDRHTLAHGRRNCRVCHNERARERKRAA